MRYGYKCKKCGRVVSVRVGNCPDCSSNKGWDKVEENEFEKFKKDFYKTYDVVARGTLAFMWIDIESFAKDQYNNGKRDALIIDERKED